MKKISRKTGIIIAFLTIIFLLSFLSLVTFNKNGIVAKVNIEKGVRSPINVTEKEKQESVSIIFGGDIMLDRYIREVGEKNGFDFILNDMDSEIFKGDVVVANLEGTITSESSVSKNSEFGSPENYIFTFDPVVTTFLKKHKIEIVNIGNNHINNFDKDGIASTREFLSNSEMDYFGDFSGQENKSYIVKTFGEIDVAFIGYNQFVANGGEKALKNIKNAKIEADFVVVYAHWGKEYETVARKIEIDLAHNFIDNGADLVIGSHPHVVQNKEIYKGKTIYYSLGNFIFDQYFSQETMRGLLVEAIFNKESREIKLEECDIVLNSSGKVTKNNKNKDCF